MVINFTGLVAVLTLCLNCAIAGFGLGYKIGHIEKNAKK